MREIQVTKYQCEYCGQIFGSEYLCKLHEKEKHKCANCEHSYYVYGCELNCELENDNKRCSYKEKKC